MPIVIYVEPQGGRHEVEVAVGTTLMQGALDHLVPGIEGDCGGLCACGTCHVYLPTQWESACGDADELERGMLEFAFDVRPNSRLSCQIEMTEALAGIEVHLPSRQY